MRSPLVPVLAIIVFALPWSATATAGVLPFEVRRATLDNGLKVILIPTPADGLVAYWSIVRTGSRDEVDKGVTGFAHFFEHMMFHGSEKYPADIYDRVVTSMGADSNAFTTDDLTAFHLSLTRADLPTAIAIESDRFQHLQYGEPEFKTEAGAVYGEYRKGRTRPFAVLFEALQNTAFDLHTYKHTTIGFESDIRAMPQHFAYSKEFFQRFYRPENVVLLVVGDFDVEQTLTRIRAAYSAWQPGYRPAEVPTEPPQKKQRRIDVPFPGQTLPILAIAFKGPALRADNPTMVAGTLAGEVAFGETSPLYKKLVLKERRVQSLFYDFGYNRDPGLWTVLALVNDPADVAAVEGEIWATIERLQSEPTTARRLDAIVSRERVGLLGSLTSPKAIAQNLSRLIAISGDVTVVDQIEQTYQRITPETLQQAARHYLTPARSTVAVLHSQDQPIPVPAAAEPPVLLPVATDPNVAVKLWWKVGSQNDPPGKEGLAALTAAMLTEAGSASRSYEEILSDLFPMATSVGGSVDKEMTVIGGVVYRDLADRYVPLLTEPILAPGFRQADFERLKQRTLTLLEKQLRYSSDEELGKAVLANAVYQGTPYAHFVAGTVDAVRGITIDDVKKFYRTYFTRDNLVIGLGGAFAKNLENRLVADLNRLPAGRPKSVPPPAAKPIVGRQVVLVEKPGNATAISFGYRVGVQRGSRDFYALWIANSWLGEHRNSVSHLYQVIREERGMNYGDYSYIEAFPNAGARTMPPTGVGRRQQLFEVWIRPVPHDRAVFALRAAVREVDHLIKDGLTAEQFAAQREFLKKYALQFATTTAARLGYAIDDRFYGIDGSGHLARFREMMGTLTRDDVNRAIRTYLQTDNLVIVMVTADAKAMKQALVSDRPSPIDYQGIEKPKEVLAEDRQIERYRLGIEPDNVQIVPVGEVFQH